MLFLTFILTLANLKQFLANFERLVLGCIRIRIRSRSVFEKKENRSRILQVNSKYSFESS